MIINGDSGITFPNASIQTKAPFGKQSIWVPASAMSSSGATAPALSRINLTVSSFYVMAFDSATEEYANFQIRMPKSWDEGNITYTPVWTANSTSATGVVWGLAAKSIGNGESLDSGWGSTVLVSDTNTSTAYQCHIAPESAPFAVLNSTESEFVMFTVLRQVANASDTLASDALLLGMMINYNTNSQDDA